MIDDNSKLNAAARALRAARVGKRPVDLDPALCPNNKDQAYQLQDLVIGTEAVAGWKILATSAPESFSCAALSAAFAMQDGAALVRGDRQPEIEVEIAIAIAADLPPHHEPYNRATVLAALGGAYAAIEIVESRFENRKKANPLSNLADAQSSRGFVIGGGVGEWIALDLPVADIALLADDVELVVSRGGANVDQILTALVWLANHASGRGRGLQSGQYVITGARVGPVIIPAGIDIISARINGIGQVSLCLA